MTKKLVAAFPGTLILVLFGCGSAVLMGADIGMTGFSLALGLAILAAACGLGAISGAHLNPAVSQGVILAGRMWPGDFIGYVAAQVAGAIAGAAVLLRIASGRADDAVAVSGPGRDEFGGAIRARIR